MRWKTQSMSSQHMWLLCYGCRCPDRGCRVCWNSFVGNCLLSQVFPAHFSLPSLSKQSNIPAVTIRHNISARSLPDCSSLSTVHISWCVCLPDRLWNSTLDSFKIDCGFQMLRQMFLLTPCIAHAALILSTTRCSAIETLCSFMIRLLQNLLTLPSKSASIASVQFHWRRPVTECCSKRLQRSFPRSVVDSLGFESLALHW